MILMLRLLINAAALLILPRIVGGIEVSGWYSPYCRHSGIKHSDTSDRSNLRYQSAY